MKQRAEEKALCQDGARELRLLQNSGEKLGAAEGNNAKCSLKAGIPRLPIEEK